MQCGASIINRKCDNMNINKERIVKEFVELASIDSESYNEREMADALTLKLQELGFEVEEDCVDDIIGGTAGNLYAFLQGDSNKESILLSGHMDTVKPGIGKVVNIDGDGKITSDGNTVLGGDDLSGVVAILEGIRMVKESGQSVGDIEIIFSVCEEQHGKGVANFDFDKIQSKMAYALDLSGPPGDAAVKAPSIVSFTANVLGKAAHAGFEPEKGLNALKAAANAIARIDQGHVGGMTVNIGKIQSGHATNIVTEECFVAGEVRSFNHDEAVNEVKRIGEIFKEEAAKLVLDKDVQSEMEKSESLIGRKQGECQFDYEVNIRAFDIPGDREVCKRFKKACSNLDLKGDLVSTHGGSDNAFFVEKGIDGIVLSCGMYNVHSVTEYSYVDDLIKGAELVAELLTIE